MILMRLSSINLLNSMFVLPHIHLSTLDLPLRSAHLMVVNIKLNIRVLSAQYVVFAKSVRMGVG